MTGIGPIHQPPRAQPRFSATQIQGDGIRFFLPGREKRTNEQIYLEYINPKTQRANTIPLEWNGRQWELPDNQRIPNKGVAYHFKDQNGKIIHDNNYIKNGWNYIPKNSANHESLGPTLLVLRDSLVTPDRMSFLYEHNLAKRNHFYRLGGNETANDFLRKHVYRHYGFKIVEDRPLIGGDVISHHGYWTSNLFQPNATLTGTTGLEKLALENLQDGTRMCFDGAFVNEGLNGIHYLANLYYGKHSPFLKWFNYGQLDAFPDQPIVLGILPATANDKPNNAAWDIRFIKPEVPGGPYFVELYDPRLEDANGNPRPGSLFLTSSQDSVQNYRFPISEQEYHYKKTALEDAAHIPDRTEREQVLFRLKTQWNAFDSSTRFRFDVRTHDNSGYSWDGQVDVKKINIQEPEVAAYVRNACTYWTDKVDRLYTTHVAKALNPLLQGNPINGQTAYRTIEAITKKHLNDEQGILPAFNQGEDPPYSQVSLENAIRTHFRNRRKQKLSPARLLTQDIASNFPLASLPVPKTLQMVLSLPELDRMLKQGDPPFLLRATTLILGPVFDLLDRFFSAVRPFAKLTQWLHNRFANPWTKQLDDKLEDSFKQLSQDTRLKLKDPLLGHLFYEQIGRSIFLSLLTGQFIPPTTDVSQWPAGRLNRMLSKSLPPEIMTATPTVAAKMMNQLLVERLQKFDFKQLNPYLESMYQPLTPESAAIARHVLHTRRLGLHWRIDALKDMGDMDAVRAIQDSERQTQRLVEEVGKIKSTMAYIAEGIRSVFPGSFIKAEITRLESLTTDRTLAKKLLRELMSGKTLNGLPNYEWFFASGHKAVGMAQRPEDEGEHQLTVSQLIENKIKPMMADLPADKAFLYQNMTANHDMSTSLYSLALFSHLARYDYYKWFGLNHNENENHVENKGVFHLVLNELQHKPQVAFLRHGIPETVFEILRKKSASDKVLSVLKHDPTLKNVVLPYLGENQERLGPIPVESKKRYVDVLMDVLADDLKLTRQSHDQLRASLKALIAEPSEVKAVRGRIADAFRDLKQNPQSLVEILPPGTNAAEVLNRIPVAVVDQAAWNLGQQYGRWLGYQQLDLTIGWTVDEVARQMPENTILQNKAIRDALKQALYNQAIQPALDQYKRIVALQVALPGDPTLYLPDLLGQAGGENLKNMYLGNRELVRTDWLKSNPVIKRYFHELGNLVQQRHNLHVLNNGDLEFPLDPAHVAEDQQKTVREALDKEGILPVIRDNGKDQAICLVNLGKPEENVWNIWMDAFTKPGKRERYPNIRLTRPVHPNYKLDLSHIRIPQGTRYRSVDAEGFGEEYIVNHQYQLVRADNPKAGIRIQTARTLVRIC